VGDGPASSSHAVTDTYDAYEQRVRARAHEIWVREGKPDGRAEDHWALAREAVSQEEGIPQTLKPMEPEGPIAEPLLAVESLGEKQDYPVRRTPSKDKTAPTKPASKRKSVAL
jgi:hypothetical protein